MAAGSAHAGGIERVAPSTRILFEEGNYLELGWGYLTPDVSGEVITNNSDLGLVSGSQSGSMLGGYSLPSLAYKHDFGGGFSGMLMYNRPYGANTRYTAPIRTISQTTTPLRIPRICRHRLRFQRTQTLQRQI